VLDLADVEIRRAVTQAASPEVAAAELFAQMHTDQMELGLFFCSADYDVATIGPELAKRFKGSKLIGCTTAGEISPLGYLDGSITGVSLPAGSFISVERRIDNISKFSMPIRKTLLPFFLSTACRKLKKEWLPPSPASLAIFS
jgi:hypothetical protein